LVVRRQHLFVERGPGDRIALYINGDLQFDSADERQYHELLVLPALALARRARKDPLHVLILGGGDGLALREVLRHDVAQVDLVDLDPDVIALAASEFRGLNEAAFEDRRVRLHTEDARAFIARLAAREMRYDAVICDLTVATSQEDCALYSVEWFAALRDVLRPGGVLVTNAVSPFATTHAFWSIHNAIRRNGFDVRPLRLALPSFIRLGYGEWGFFLAGVRPLGDLAGLELRPGTVVDAATVRAALRLPRSIVAVQAEASPESRAAPALLHYLLNPAEELVLAELDDELVDFAGGTTLGGPHQGEAAITALSRALDACLPLRDDEPIDLDRVVERLPLQHRYQTRAMLRELSVDWTRYIGSLDIEALIEAVLSRVRELPPRLRRELRALRKRLQAGVPDPERLLAWGGRLVSVLVIVVILANTLMPENAFAKGPGGGAHFSAPHSVVQNPPSALTHNLVSDRVGPNRVTDFYGNYYPRGYYYYHPYYYGGSHPRPSASPQPSPSPSPPPDQTQPAQPPQLFASAYQISADAIVLENGGAVVTLDPQHYLAVASDALLLMRQDDATPVYALYRSPTLVARLTQALGAQVEGIGNYVEDLQMRQSGIRLYERSAERISTLKARLEQAQLQLGTPGAAPALPFANSREIFASVYALSSGAIALHEADGTYRILYGDRLYAGEADITSQTPLGDAPVELRTAVRTVMQQVVDNDTAELRALQVDIDETSHAQADALHDLGWYETDQRDEGPQDVVDYGTSQIYVRDAIEKARADLSRIERQRTELEGERGTLDAERAQFANALRHLA
jgi:spermidine synthase